MAVSTPRILLDATQVPVKRGGVGRYIDQLALALDALGTDLCVACQARDEAFFADGAPHSRVVALPTALDRRSTRMVWEQTGLVNLARRLRVDVVHSPHYSFPLAAGRATVVSVFDATFFTDRELHGGYDAGLKGPYLRTWTRAALRRATLCVTTSEASVRELTRVTGCRPDRLVVSHLGADPSIFAPPSADERARVADRLGVGSGRWVAFLGTHEPRKNIPALIDGFVRAVLHRPDPPALLLAGADGWDRQVGPAIAAVPAGLTVRRVGYLPIDDLRAFLGGALVVAYPSLGEGFGLPVLEAMATGAAVLTTRRLSLPEVGGDAVAYCDVGADSIAEVLGRLLDHPEERAALGRAALARAASFSPEATAGVHQEAYERAARSARR